MFPILLYARRREANRHLIRLRREIRNNSRPFDLSDNRFIELFRLDKPTVHQVIDFLEPHLRQPTREHGIPIEVVVLTALRFFATGSSQRCIGQYFNLGLSQTSVHRCIRLVTSLIVQHLSAQYITFPQTVALRQDIKASFMQHFGFPGIIGAIDCTHIAILKPAVEEHNFINRKFFHSLNVQCICDDMLRIINVYPNWGGSTHDAFVWRNSQIQTYMRQMHQAGERNSWLIGDSGYGLQPYLLTPVHNPQPGTPEARYNEAHIAARNCIERCFGMLKMRFRCLLKERVARYAPDFVANLVIACATLHNMCVQNNIPLVGDANEELPPEDEEYVGVDAPPPEVLNLLQEGRLCRQRVITNYFTNR